MQAYIAEEFRKSLENFQRMQGDAALQAEIARAVALCVASLRGGGKIMFAGNGGSAADAQHWAGDLVSRL
jgi:D-sedoheptulose 7-phosphate isomerase